VLEYDAREVLKWIRGRFYLRWTCVWSCLWSAKKETLVSLWNDRWMCLVRKK